MTVRTPKKYRIQKPMLVPAQWQGSVEHFYHFLLGYFVPIVLWQEKTQVSDFAVRDCGPMNPWFDLLADGTKVDYLPPGVMLQRTLTFRQEHQILWDWDNPTRFHRKSLRAVSRVIRERVQVNEELERTSEVRVTLLNRGLSPDFYSTDKAEVIGSGAEIRSVPNMSDLERCLMQHGVLSCIDAAVLPPDTQVRQFMKTDILIAQHGAGLSNMLWMSPGSTVVEIQPPLPQTVDQIFSNLAAAMGIKHVVFRQEHEHSEIDPVALDSIVKAVREGNHGSVPKSPTRFPLQLIRQLPRSW